MATKYEVGQRLWWVPSERYLGQPRYVTITKVGRRWLATSERDVRIDLETLRADSQGYSVGRCYQSANEWQSEADLDNSWYELRRTISGCDRPKGLTAEDIRQAMRLLKLRTYDE